MIENHISICDAALLASSALNELANLANKAPVRLEYRREAIQVCKQSLEKEKSSGLGISLANRAVDLFMINLLMKSDPQ